MRVAVLEPHPRSCGVTAWGFHHAVGYRTLGHVCDVVSFTRSGRPRATRTKTGGVRPGWRWWPDEPDVTARWEDAPDVLDGYDLVVLNEPKNGPLDFDARKTGNGAPPEYVAALARTKTPWVTALHDARAYTPAAAPFLAECVAAPSFTGLAVECRPGSYACGEWALAGRVTRLQPWPWLPYAARGPTPGATRLRVVALGGRATTTKGFQTVASVADDLPEGWELRLFGPEAGGMGPSVSFRVYEALARHGGWRGERRDPAKAAYHSDRDQEINNLASVNSGRPWWLARGGRVVRYTGAYEDAVAEWSAVGVGVQLSTDRIVTTFEYTTLEALDGGCALAVPAYYVADMGPVEYPGVALLERFSRGARFPKDGPLTWDDEPARAELLDTVRLLAKRVESGEHDPAAARAAVVRYHDPRHLAAKILEVL